MCVHYAAAAYAQNRLKQSKQNHHNIKYRNYHRQTNNIREHSPSNKKKRKQEHGKNKHTHTHTHTHKKKKKKKKKNVPLICTKILSSSIPSISIAFPVPFVTLESSAFVQKSYHLKHEKKKKKEKKKDTLKGMWREARTPCLGEVHLFRRRTGVL
jgi:hypothetical protein